MTVEPAAAHIAGSAEGAAGVACAQNLAHLSYSPAHIDPNNSIWAGSRKPLALQVHFGGSSLFLIGIDLASKETDSPLFGAQQPPQRPSEALRYAQASAVADFAQQIFACEQGANVWSSATATINQRPELWRPSTR